MNWIPTLVVISLYLLLMATITVSYQLLERLVGWEEIGKRWKLVKMAATGNDYRMPTFDPGTVRHQEFPHPSVADDPITAILVRSSEAERRWYALHHLLDYWEQDLKHRRTMRADEEKMLDQFLHRQFRKAQDEASHRIQARIELKRRRDSDNMVTTYIIEDPSTGVQQRIQMSDRDLIRFDDHQDLPPAVQQRIDSFPQWMLGEVEQRSDTLETRV